MYLSLPFLRIDVRELGMQLVQVGLAQARGPPELRILDQKGLGDLFFFVFCLFVFKIYFVC